MSTRVTKAQLQDEVEKLRALVDHLETTNAALKDQVAALRADAEREGLGHNDELIDQLRTDVQQLQAKNEALRAENEALRAGQQQRVVRKVFEFNPAVPGDFARAMSEARKHNGVVRRMTQ